MKGENSEHKGLKAGTKSAFPRNVAINDLLSSLNISLDFFRGIMALLVAVGHFYYWNNQPSIPLSFILAVDFFLVLSGFVLCHSVARQGSCFDSVSFAKNRWLRLFPVYSACVMLTVPLAVWLNHLHGARIFDIFRIITISEMIPLWDNSPFQWVEPLGISYTISAELWVGIFLFPIYSVLAAKCRNLVFPVFIFIILWAILSLNTTPFGLFLGAHHKLYFRFLDGAIIRCLLDYSIGTITYILFIRITTISKAFWLSAGQISCILAFVLLYCKFNYHRNNEFLAPFLFASFIFLCAFRDGIIYRLTNNRLGVFLDDISYPVYLIHPFWILIFKYISLNLSLTAILPVYAALVIASSWLINRIIEKPCLKLLKKQPA